MAEETIEINLSEKEQEDFNSWEQYYSQRGQSIPRRTILQKVLAGFVAPILGQNTETSASGRENLQSGNMGPFLTERPEAPQKEDLSPIEQDMWRINRDKVVKATGENAYVKPPGEKVTLGDWDNQQWAEYGWAASKKAEVKNLLADVFHIDFAGAERAAEALLLAGYTADEVVGKVTDEQAKDKEDSAIRKYGSMGGFQTIFSDRQHTIHESSAKIVFGQEAFEASKNVYADPQTMEEVAWQLGWTGAAGGPTGAWMQTDKDGAPNKHAMFEARMKTLAERDKDIREKNDYSWGKYYVNENSFLHWFRKEIEVLYDIWGPDTPIQVMEQVQSRVSSMKVTRLREMVEKQEAFKSEDGNTQYLQLWLKLQLEPGGFQSLYDNDIIYRQSVVTMDKWLEQYENMTFMNPLTKLGFRTNKVQQLLTGTTEYHEARGDVENGRYMSDNKLGGAFSEMVLAFYNLGDFKELQETLGTDSSFFTRSGWIQAMEDISAIQGLRSGGGIKLSPDETKAFDKAFKEGRVLTGSSEKAKESQQQFIKFINTLGNSNLPGSHLELTVTRAIRNSVAKRFELENTPGLELTTAQAWFFNRFMGGLARNDINTTEYTNKKGQKFYTPNPSVHDKMSELLNMGANREKYASQGGGKPSGNILTLGQFKAAAIEPMVGIVTMQKVPVYDIYGNKVKGHTMQKSMLMVFKEAHKLRVKQQERINKMKAHYHYENLPEGANKAHIKTMIEQEEKEQNKMYQHYVADNAAFHENAHREYTQVHLKAGKQWMDRIMNGKGLDFNNFTSFDPFGGGATVKRDVLIKDFQKDMLGLTRDMVKKYKWMNFNEDVRVPYYDRQTGEHGFRDGKLWEKEFGYDMLNRKEFWLEDDKGRYVKENGLHVIDANKVNKDRVQLMKQMFMTELGADMMNHQKLNSGDVRFNHVYYLNVLNVLKTMPGQVIIDEFKKNGIDVPEGFFTDEDFKWLKARALNGNVLGIDMGSFGFHLKWWLSSLWDKTDREGLGFGKAFGIISKAIFSNL